MSEVIFKNKYIYILARGRGGALWKERGEQENYYRFQPIISLNLDFRERIRQTLNTEIS